MKRYYICPLVKITEPGESKDYNAPKVHQHSLDGVRLSFVAEIPTNNQTGQPLFNWCLVCVEATDHTALLADPEMEALPDATDLNSSVNVSVELQERLSNRGIDVSLATTLREVVRASGQRLSSNFHEDKFRVSF